MYSQDVVHDVAPLWVLPCVVQQMFSIDQLTFSHLCNLFARLFRISTTIPSTKLWLH